MSLSEDAIESVSNHEGRVQSSIRTFAIGYRLLQIRGDSDPVSDFWRLILDPKLI